MDAANLDGTRIHQTDGSGKKIRRLYSIIAPLLPYLMFFVMLSAYFGAGLIWQNYVNELDWASANMRWWIAGLAVGFAAVTLALSAVLSIKFNSDRRRALKAFEVSQMQLQAVFSNTPVCLNLKDTDGRYLLVNKPYEEWLGHSAEEIIGKKASEFLTSETEVKGLSAAEHRVLATGEVYEREVSVKRGDGRTYHRILIKYPVKGADGSIGAIGTVAIDVTDRKAIEDELRALNAELEVRVQNGIDEVREIEGRFRHAFENAPIGVALITPEGNRFQVNQALADFLGYSVEELTDTTMRSTAGNTGDLDKSMVLRQKVLDGEIETYRNERRYRRKDGDIVWGEVSGALYRNPNGKPEHFIAHTIDITERKQAELALRESEAQIRLITDSSPALITYIDLDLRYRFANQTATEWFARPMDQILDRPVRELLGEVEMEKISSYIERVLAGERVTYESTLTFPDGVTRHFEANFVPDVSEDGTVNGCFNFVTDATERKSSEMQLRQAQKMEAVGQLTGGVAHDFNNLLAVIRGNAELLAKKIGHNNTMLQGVLRASERGAELTQRLLAYSRQQTLQSRPIGLAELVGGMTGLLKRTLGETFEIETVAKGDLALVMVDPGQVENALLNLTINARDAMPQGGKLTIECQNAHLDEAYVARNPEAVAGDYVVLAVSDNGAGMSAEVQTQAFEPFFTTKDVGEGSGLGLSMVYGFAKQSGGHVSIYSEKDQGTTVKIYLPRAEGESQVEEKSASEDIPQGLGETILVIEDNADVRALAIQMLEDLGYRSIGVPDAQSATATLANDTMPDLVLSDVVLPGGISGPEFAETARETYPDLKVIFMSGHPAQASKRNGFLGSDQLLLNKPFQMRQLAEALRKALG